MSDPRHPATVAVNAGRPSQPGDPLNQPITPVSTYLAGGDSHYHRDAAMPEHAVETVLGAARLLARSGTDPEELRRQVTSPKGMTLAGLTRMEARDFRGTLRETVLAAKARSEEMSRDA